MAKKYFGTDGVRGEVGQFPITPDFVLKLGYAAGQVLVQHDDEHRPTVLIGKDTRMPDYLILISTLGGLALLGLNGFVIGPLVAALFVANWNLFEAKKKVRLPD